MSGAVDGKGDERAVKLRHVAAEPLSADVQGELRESGDDPNEDLGAQFLMSTWPTPTPAVRAEVDKLCQMLTHKLVPIAAYDIDGLIIPPGDYVHKLPGAVVEARFTLCHVKIGGTHYYSADIAQLD
ncbi:hypothetical protein FB45DRAFT_867907 [Roridomyces roridus]|uniref:Uncharacterized protein n=1 Tax=Roridomyces roridus TaxID=1738132 RepID=A0AAD7FKB0_9AGAR|nr:hypothetical protein FB45DRAFT_867907 [Roridomyces roridus]